MISGFQEGEPFCCCEYENLKGERSHLLACCCDCEAFDQAFDHCITCQEVPTTLLDRVFETMDDRCRLPGIFGRGAVKLHLDIFVPIISVPLCLVLATIGPISTFLVLCFMPIFMLWFYRNWRLRSRKVRTKFFFIWGLTSSVFMLVVFESFVVAYREILLWENMLLVSCGFLTFYFMIKTKLSERHLQRKIYTQPTQKRRQEGEQFYGNNENFPYSQNETELLNIENGSVQIPGSVEEMTAPVLREEEVKWVDSRPIRDGKLSTWCSDCRRSKPARSGHCSVCRTCIDVRDHHCVWIDCCIGSHNHQSFFAAMALFIFCGFYGVQLSMTTVCTPEMYFDYFLYPSDCRFLYIDFQSSISFVCCCYTFMVSCVMLVGLLHQLLLISQNITSQELHNASIRHMTKYFGLLATNNIHNEGFLTNWKNFIIGSRKKSSLMKV